MVATIHETQIDVSVQLVDGGDPYVTEPGERVVAHYADQSQGLVYAPLLDFDPYVGRIVLAGPVAGDAPISLSIERGSDVVRLEGSAPPPLTVTTPTSVSDNADLTVSWAPVATDPMGWSDDNGNDGPIREDRGALVFPPGVFAEPDLSFAQPVTLTVLRQRRTEVDSELVYSIITVTQQSTAMFMVTP